MTNLLQVRIVNNRTWDIEYDVNENQEYMSLRIIFEQQRFDKRLCFEYIQYHCKRCCIVP